MRIRQGFLIAIILTTLLCALPGLFMFCSGIISIIGFSTDEVNDLADPILGMIKSALVILLLVIGLIGILTPIVIGLVARQQKIKESRQPPANWNEPIPPPS